MALEPCSSSAALELATIMRSFPGCSVALKWILATGSRKGARSPWSSSAAVAAMPAVMGSQGGPSASGDLTRKAAWRPG